MKKRGIVLGAICWTLAVAALAWNDSRFWEKERALSVCTDGETAGDICYLAENTEDDGILYVTDENGEAVSVSLLSAVQKNSRFEYLDFENGNLYGVISMPVEGTDVEAEQTEELTAYRILRYDEMGRPEARTAPLILEQGGSLTGFAAEPEGFYLTVIFEDGKQTGVYQAEPQLLTELSVGQTVSSEEIVEKAEGLSLFRLTDSENGRQFVKARYEKGSLQAWTDDGKGVEAFVLPPQVLKAFELRSVSLGQSLQIRQEQVVFYVLIYLAGAAVFVLLRHLLRRRSHTAYTMAFTGAVLLVTCFTVLFTMVRYQGEVQRRETRQFAFSSLRSLSQEIGDPELLEAEGFYENREYEEVRKRLAGLVRAGDFFSDLLVARTSDGRILASGSGRNQATLGELYGETGRQILGAVLEGNKKAETGRLFAVPFYGSETPAYIMAGEVQSLETEFGDLRMHWYVIGTAGLFLVGLLGILGILYVQNRQLKKLASAMRSVAEGGTQVQKEKFLGTDLEGMWNSLAETGRNISRIHYNGYRMFESCYRFAPGNIEKLFDRASIAEVAGGDTVSLHGPVAILSNGEPGCDGEETADVLNRFVDMVVYHQKKHGGFLVSGQSSLRTFRVLFPGEHDVSMAFASGFMQELSQKDPMNVLGTGILLYDTDCIYGVAGTKEQSYPFLLSPELEEMEAYGEWLRQMKIRLAVTDEIRRREMPDCLCRYLGYLFLPKSGKRDLYEVLDVCESGERKRRLGTKERFQKGLSYFYQHDFYLARSTFSDVLKEDPTDLVAKWYLFTCEKYLNEISVSGDVYALRRE